MLLDSTIITIHKGELFPAAMIEDLLRQELTEAHETLASFTVYCNN